MVRALEEMRDGADLPASLRDLRGAPLQGADLSKLVLHGVDLSGADLSNADLTEAVLMGARLEGTVLFQANLEGTELAGADLSYANLERARCHQTGFGSAKLHHTSLLEADLEHASLTQAELVEVDLRAARLRGARLREAVVQDCDLTRADLRHADLDEADVTGSVFQEADLREAHFLGITGYEKASWIGADLRDVNFAGAWLFRRFANDQNYLQEFRTQSPWSAFAYRVWWLTSDCGRSLVRWGVCTFAISVVFAVAYSFVDIGYGDHETFLSPLYYSVVTLTTLGYGDVLPRSAAAQALAMIEVICGYVMLGGMLAIFSNKLARRAD